MDSLERVDTVQLLDSAIAACYRWEAALGNNRKGRATKAFEALRDGQLKIDNTIANLERVDLQQFLERGLILPDALRTTAGKFKYYVLSIPILLFPARGAQYRLIEAAFTLDAPRGQSKPRIVRIFPEPLWKPILQWGGHLELALDANLQWGVELASSHSQLRRVRGELSARVADINQLNSFIRVIPFTHEMGRMEIESQYSSRTAMWRLDSIRTIREQKHVQFAMLLQVPEKTKYVQVRAAVQADVAFDWLFAQVEHVFARLPKLIQNALRNRKGLPLQTIQAWELRLPE